MVDNKELRLGNILKGTTREGSVLVAPVHEIMDSEVSLIFEGLAHKFTHDRIDPIPLTPEILEKAGFEKIGDNGYIIYEFEDEKNANEGFYVECEGDGYAYYYPSNTAMDVQINYLHQLQNLFFCLTGEELKINL